jgi:hypothetical protein
VTFHISFYLIRCWAGWRSSFSMHQQILFSINHGIGAERSHWCHGY